MASNEVVQDGLNAILSILTSPHGVVNKNDVSQIVKSVLQSQQALLNHGEEQESFYGPYAALSAHYISTCTYQVSKSQIGSTAKACQVLLQYLLQQLQNFNENSSLLQKQIMTLIKSMCKNSGSLQCADVITLTTMLKSAKVPSDYHSKSVNSPDGKDDLKEPQRLRLDPSTVFLEQLMTPILETSVVQKKEVHVEKAEKDGEVPVINVPDVGEEVKSILMNKNLISLQQLNGGDILLQMCLKLRSLQHYSALLQDTHSDKGLSLPNCVSGALQISNSYKAVMNDINIVWRALSLPVLEPLTEDRLQKLTTIALSCLYASVSVAMATSILSVAASPPAKGVAAYKDDENDNCAVSIVETSLEIYNAVAAAIRASTRAGGHNLQNLHLVGSWLLLKGLLGILNLNPGMLMDKAKDSSSKGKGTPDQTPTKGRDQASTPKQNIIKIQQGFGVLCVALASHSLTLMTYLLDDLRVETGSVLSAGASTSVDVHATTISVRDIMACYTAWQRIQKLTSSIDLSHLLFSLASVSYRKACMLKRIQKHPVDGDTFSTSDSNTYYEDDFSSSDESSGDDDDDSEPILGQWFEETLAPQDTTPNTPAPPAVSSGSESTAADGKSPQRPITYPGTLIPEKGEPHGYINLASKIFGFLNNYFVNSDNHSIRDYLRQSVGEPQMVILAGIVKDLDKETSRSDSGTISIYFGAVLGQLYEEFSHSLARFIHNMLATSMLSDVLQNALLDQLGVNPWTQEEWPLQVCARTLSVLAQTLLLRQHKEKDELRSETQTSCVQIWHHFMGILKKAILSGSPVPGMEEGEDINVEHAQLLLLLFHCLQLMQKKTVLLETAQTIIDITPVMQSVMKDYQILLLARLLLLFEYMMKNLYDDPASLIEQIQTNLFSAQAVATLSEKDNTRSHSKMFFPCKEIEENYLKNISAEEQGSTMKPRFYHLMSVDFINQDAPKLDGFALSFVLGTPDILKYSNLYNTIICLLGVVSQCDSPERSTSDKLSFLGNGAVQYCFSICWRLLMSLPPSVHSLETLATGNSMLGPAHSLHAAIWVPRAGHKVYSGWMKDTLVKQGLTTQKSEALLRSITKVAGNIKYDIKLLKQFISRQLMQGPTSYTEPIPKERLPHVLDMMVLEALIAKIQVVLDDCFSKSLNEPAGGETKDLAQELLPIILQLVEMYTACTRWSLLHQITETSAALPGGASAPSVQTLKAYDTVLCMSSGRCAKLSSFTTVIAGYLPASLRGALDQWNSCTVSMCGWRNDFAGDILSSESYIASVQSSHIATLSGQPGLSTSLNLKRLLNSIVRFAGDLTVWCPETRNSKELVHVMLPLLLDASTESLVDCTTLILERVVGLADSDEFLTRVYHEVLIHIYDLLIKYSNKESDVDERIFHECLKLMESLVDKQAGKRALEEFFTDNGERGMINILLSAASANLSPVYGTRVLKFFSKLFQQMEKNPGDKSLEQLCSTLSRRNKLSDLDTGPLQHWLSKMVSGTTIPTDEGNSVQENRLLLQNLTSYIVKENSGIG